MKFCIYFRGCKISKGLSIAVEKKSATWTWLEFTRYENINHSWEQQKNLPTSLSHGNSSWKRRVFDIWATMGEMLIISKQNTRIQPKLSYPKLDSQ